MLDFGILLLPGAHGTSVSATLDLLGAAALIAPGLGVPAPRWQVYSPSGGSVTLSQGLAVRSRRLPVRLPSGRPTWVVPGLGVTSARRADTLMQTPDAQALVRWLQRVAAQGSPLAASCSGVLALAEAGVLQGRRATTAWWLAPLLRQRAPGADVDERRMVIEDGPVVTAGAAFAQADLMLWLLRRRFGQPLSEAVARALLVDGRPLQAPYIDPAVLHSGHELLARVEAEVRAMLPRAPSVQALAHALSMSPRTLARRVRSASGRSPLALIQSVRLAAARTLLEASALPVDEVAHRVGYADPTALRRLLKKAWGVAPRQMRRPGA